MIIDDSDTKTLCNNLNQIIDECVGDYKCMPSLGSCVAVSLAFSTLKMLELPIETNEDELIKFLKSDNVYKTDFTNY